MTALLSTLSVAVIVALLGVVAVYLWVIGNMVQTIASVLAEQVAPGAQAVAGHVSAMGPATGRLDAAIGQLG